MKVMPRLIHTSGFQTQLHMALIRKAVKTLPTKTYFINSDPKWVSIWSSAMVDINLSATSVFAAESPLSVAGGRHPFNQPHAGDQHWGCLLTGQRVRAGLATPAPPEGQPKDAHAHAMPSHCHHELTSAGSAALYNHPTAT